MNPFQLNEAFNQIIGMELKDGRLFVIFEIQIKGVYSKVR
jgi:hypothetical protein